MAESQVIYPLTQPSLNTFMYYKLIYFKVRLDLPAPVACIFNSINTGV